MKLVYKKPRFKKHQLNRANAELKKKSSKRTKKNLPESRLPTLHLRNALRDRRLKWNKARRKFLISFYQRRNYSELPKSISVKGHLGLEHNFLDFLNFASSFMDNYSRETFLDITESERIWPTAIMLFVSQMEWARLTAANRMRISSSDSKNNTVNSYLTRSGFYKYVGRSYDQKYEETDYDNTQTVTIRVEANKFDTKLRHFEITDLVERHSALSPDELERFNCIIMSEILANVTEHGVASKYAGWFVLAQCHKKSGIISICIGDNGIGIKNSLLTGGQRKEIFESIPIDKQKDSVLMAKALQEFVSGALEAEPPIKGLFGRQSVPTGSKRGRGLKKVLTTCKQIGAELNLLSQYGCVRVDKSGNITDTIDSQKRCFAGTLYHIVLPARKNEE